MRALSVSIVPGKSRTSRETHSSGRSVLLQCAEHLVELITLTLMRSGLRRLAAQVVAIVTCKGGTDGGAVVVVVVKEEKRVAMLEMRMMS
jgi:hypothetical protein